MAGVPNPMNVVDIVKFIKRESPDIDEKKALAVALMIDSKMRENLATDDDRPNAEDERRAAFDRMFENAEGKSEFEEQKNIMKFAVDL